MRGRGRECLGIWCSKRRDRQLSVNRFNLIKKMGIELRNWEIDRASERARGLSVSCTELAT